MRSPTLAGVLLMLNIHCASLNPCLVAHPCPPGARMTANACVLPDGRRQGPATTRGAHQAIVTQRWYRAGKPDGPTVVCYEDGATMMSIEFRGGLAEGVTRTFYPSGALDHETYYHRGARSGTHRRWSEQGVLVTEGQHLHDRRDGCWRFWHLNGALAMTGCYDQGACAWPELSSPPLVIAVGECAVGRWLMLSATGALLGVTDFGSGRFIDTLELEERIFRGTSTSTSP